MQAWQKFFLRVKSKGIDQPDNPTPDGLHLQNPGRNSEIKGNHSMSKTPRESGRSTQRFSDPEFINSLNKTGIRHLVGKSSHRGRRRNENEDSIATLEHSQIFKSVSQPIGIFLVSDGLGGYQGGDIASRIAVQSITQQLARQMFNHSLEESNDAVPQDSYRRMLEQAVFTANDLIFQKAQLLKNEMGATITAALVVGRTAYIMNVGDSRTYLFNRENGLQLITQDHSLVFRFYLMRDLKLDEIYNHPQRNQILRSLGEAGLKENLDEMLEQSNHPYYYQITLEQGDSLLLCSDGLWQEVRDAEIEKVLAAIPEPQLACERLIDKANFAGGEDNISVIYVKID
jgi:serine/threonine protein phosphatase PrpC